MNKDPIWKELSKKDLSKVKAKKKSVGVEGEDGKQKNYLDLNNKQSPIPFKVISLLVSVHKLQYEEFWINICFVISLDPVLYSVQCTCKAYMYFTVCTYALTGMYRYIITQVYSIHDTVWDV